MSKKKKQPVQLTDDELEAAKKVLLKQVSCVNEELQRLVKKLETSGADITNETEAIGDCLSNIENEVQDIITRSSEILLEKEEAEKEKAELQGKYDDLMEITELTQFSNTMVGELKYETNNLLDSQIMELFTECLIDIRPVDMIENLKTIKQYKIVI